MNLFLQYFFKKLITFSFFLIILFLISCGEFDSKVGSVEEIKDIDKIPTMIISNYETISYTKGKINWIMLSDQAELFDKTQRTFLKKVNFKNYDGTSKETSTAVALYSILENDTGNFVLEKDVVIINRSGTIIEGKYFYWDDKIKRFTSPNYVKITKKDGSIISGVGFSANQNLGDVEFKSNVSGQIGKGNKEDFFQGFE